MSTGWREEPDSSAQRLLPEPSSRAAGTEPGVRGKPVRIMSGNVLTDREMPSCVCVCVVKPLLVPEDPSFFGVFLPLYL